MESSLSLPSWNLGQPGSRRTEYDAWSGTRTILDDTEYDTEYYDTDYITEYWVRLVLANQR